MCVRDEGEWYRRPLSPTTIEVSFRILSIDVVATFLEKNCLTNGKLLSVTFYKSFDPESVDFFACAPHIIHDVFNGRRLPFGLSPEAKLNKGLLLF
jgi:hypothetical protein